MVFWIFMLVMNLMLPAVMILFGRSFAKNPPTAINHAYGYRTKMSMKNMDTWTFAHKHFGTLWSRLGWVFIAATIVAMLFVIDKNTDTVGTFGGIVIGIQLVILLASIYPTEKALRKEFDENGNRREEQNK